MTNLWVASAMPWVESQVEWVEPWEAEWASKSEKVLVAVNWEVLMY